MSSETVNPMPPSSDRPSTSGQPRCSSSSARVKRDTSQVAPVIPIALPSTSPTAMPTATLSVIDSVSPESPPTATPAEKKANTGTAMPAEIGRIRCSKCSASPGPASGPPAASLRTTGTVEASSTPATVACTPDSCMSTQVTAASGSSSHQERIRFCTSSPNSASGRKDSSRAVSEKSSV